MLETSQIPFQLQPKTPSSKLKDHLRVTITFLVPKRLKESPELQFSAKANTQRESQVKQLGFFPRELPRGSAKPFKALRVFYTKKTLSKRLKRSFMTSRITQCIKKTRTILQLICSLHLTKSLALDQINRRQGPLELKWD